MIFMINHFVMVKKGKKVYIRFMTMKFHGHFKPFSMIFCTLCGLMLLFSCSVRQEITLKPDMSGVWSISGEAPPFAGAALDDLAIIGGYNDASALYGKILLETENALSERKDIHSHSIKMTGKHQWEGSIDFADLKTLLGSGEEGGIVSLETAGERSVLSLHLNRSTAASLEKLVPLLSDPALSLFNPAYTSTISEEEYIQNVLAFAFGEENLDDIRKARMVLVLSVPGKIHSVSGGRKISEHSARFTLPFTRLMVPEEPVDWTVTWAN